MGGLLNQEDRRGVRADSIRAATVECERNQMLSKRRSRRREWESQSERNARALGPTNIGKRKKGVSKPRDPESGSGRLEFTHVAVLESADDARQNAAAP
jgi:hypothetical protein